MLNDPSPGEADRTLPGAASGGVGGKRCYQPPRLTVFGTIVELTFGRSGNLGDVLVAGSGGF